MRIEIPGKIQGKQRPRVTKKGITFTPHQTVSYENLIKYTYKKEKGPFFEGQIKLKITAYFEIPKSKSKKEKELMLKNVIRPTKKPDADNIIKIVCDALNKIAYHDDSQVVSVIFEKFYAEEEKLIIEIEGGIKHV